MPWQARQGTPAQSPTDCPNRNRGNSGKPKAFPRIPEIPVWSGRSGLPAAAAVRLGADAAGVAVVAAGLAAAAGATGTATAAVAGAARRAAGAAAVLGGPAGPLVLP